MKRAVFLDRDGVITQEPPHYAHKIDQLRLIKNAAKAIRILNQAGFLIIIITNQAGIAKGLFKEEDTLNFNKEMLKRLNKQGAKIDAIYFCPHHPKAKIPEYRCDCSHRKPKSGMLQKAKDEYNINFKESYLIGDKISDIESGKKVKCKSMLVKTGLGRNESKMINRSNLVFNNIYQAAVFIVKGNT